MSNPDLLDNANIRPEQSVPEFGEGCPEKPWEDIYGIASFISDSQASLHAEQLIGNHFCIIYRDKHLAAVVTD